MFTLALSIGFLYDWHVCRGKEDPLSGANAMYRLIYYTLLVDKKWDFCNVVLFCDAAFTSFRLFRDLWVKRGISAVGPINASKPSKGGGPNSWPHQKFKSSDTKYLRRGWDRTAFTPMQRGGWLQAVTWRDNKFVKMLSSVYITVKKIGVKRCVCMCVCMRACVRVCAITLTVY